MHPLTSFLPQALARAIRTAPLTPDKVAFAWRTAVGPAVDRATIVRLDGAVLRVRARDDAWRNEVARSVGLVKARLESLLGAGVVRRIEIDGEASDKIGPCTTL